MAVAPHRVGPDTARSEAGTVERCRRGLATATVICSGVIENSIEVGDRERAEFHAGQFQQRWGWYGNLGYARSLCEGDIRILVRAVLAVLRLS